MRRLKILQCLVFYLPNRVGGIEVYVHALNRQLRRKGHDVKVLVPEYPGEPPYPSIIDDIPVVIYPGTLNSSKAEFAGDVAGKGIAAFTEQLQKQAPDIVHFHQFTSSNGISIFQIKAAKDLGIPVVYTNHLAGLTCNTGTLRYCEKEYCDGIIREVKCSICTLERQHIKGLPARAAVYGGHFINRIFPGIENRPGKLFRLLGYTSAIKKKREKVTSLLEMVDCFVVLTDWYDNVLKRNGLPLDKVKIIRQALTIETSGNKASRGYTADGVVRLVFAGRIFPEKGLIVLLNALANLDAGKITLDIYGQVDNQNYEQRCKTASHGKQNIRWLGVLNNKDMLTTFSNYDILVLPSMIAEMAPLIIQEAFAAGLPVIGSDCPGIAEEITDDENGFLFEMGNAGVLQKILQRIINDPGIIARKAEKIKDARSFLELTNQVEEQYMKLLK